MALLVGITVFYSLDSTADEKYDDFGLWKGSLNTCSVVRVSHPHGQRQPMECNSFRLNQQIRGIISVRFESWKGVNNHNIGKLVLAGVLEEKSLSMRCRQGRCQPQFPIKLQISALAESYENDLGLASKVPHSYLARGYCQIEISRVHCVAKTLDGIEWSADASR